MTNEKKTVYITRNALFKNLTMILCNNITEADKDFIDDNYELYRSPCDECGGSGEKDSKTCDECCGEGSYDSEIYQYFLISAHDWEIDRLKEYGVNLGYSKLLDLHVLPIYDFGTGWNAFSYSKEADANYQLDQDETLTRQTVY